MRRCPTCVSKPPIWSIPPIGLVTRRRSGGKKDNATEGGFETPFRTERSTLTEQGARDFSPENFWDHRILPRRPKFRRGSGSCVDRSGISGAEGKGSAVSRRSTARSLADSGHRGWGLFLKSRPVEGRRGRCISSVTQRTQGRARHATLTPQPRNPRRERPA